MTRVAGVDGTPCGWAVVIEDAAGPVVRKVSALSDLLHIADFKVVAIDVPIGLLGAYEIGGRACDRAARKLLGRRRGSSVFPAPVRPVLAATSWEDACDRSRTSAPHRKAISKQTFAILPKIREINELLQTRPELRHVVREVHPEVCFCELVGAPLAHRKDRLAGREERRRALARVFPQLEAIEKAGRAQGLPMEDVLDALAACWSARRLADGHGHSLPATVPHDATGLPMAIWV
jgi:predicted RNase H-like nuclease